MMFISRDHKNNILSVTVSRVENNIRQGQIIEQQLIGLGRKISANELKFKDVAKSIIDDFSSLKISEGQYYGDELYCFG